MVSLPTFIVGYVGGGVGGLVSHTAHPPHQAPNWLFPSALLDGEAEQHLRKKLNEAGVQLPEDLDEEDNALAELNASLTGSLRGGAGERGNEKDGEVASRKKTRAAESNKEV